MQSERIDVRWGKLRLRTLAFEVATGQKCETVTLIVGEKPLAVRHELADGKVTIHLPEEITIDTGGSVIVTIG